MINPRSLVFSSLCLISSALSFVLDQESESNSASGWIKGKAFGHATVRYREVPTGTCELTEGVKSYSGYVDISEDVHMFFWFFEARNVDPTTAPLTAWISGGPGASSMSELFTEHGPCRIRPDGKSVVYNPFSWNNISNVVYIDQPVMVGFSYTELDSAYCNDAQTEIIPLAKGATAPANATIVGNFSIPDTSMTANSTEAAAPNFWKTLQGFMQTFPQYSSHGFNFGSESYGGHYVPVFSKYITDQNAKKPDGAVHIDLRSILVGNGWFSPILQTKAYLDFGFNHPSTYDLPPMNDSVREQVHNAMYGKGQCLDQLMECNTVGNDVQCNNADQFSGNEVQQPWLTVTNRGDEDIREMEPIPFPQDFYTTYLNLPDVREKIGAEQSYIEQSPVVGDAFELTGDDARELGILNILKELVDSGVKVTLYDGDADYECNWLGVQTVSETLGIEGFEAPRTEKSLGVDQAGYVDVQTPDGIVHGQVKQSGIFSFVRVYEAGHAVGAYQPLMQQTIFERTISGSDLETGKVKIDKDYRSNGTLESTYIEGNRTVQWTFNNAIYNNGTYDYLTNLPTIKDFEPFWPPDSGNGFGGPAGTNDD